MSDVSQGAGWWQASDGKWYPPESRSGVQQPSGPEVSEVSTVQPMMAHPGAFAEGSAQTVYPPAGVQSPMSPAAPVGGISEQGPKKKRTKWIIAASVIVVVAVAAVLLISKGNGSSQGLPPGESLSQMNADVLQKARATGSENPGWIEARSVSCIPPSRWATGQTFQCYIYDAGGKALGIMHGTVLPTDPGDAFTVNQNWVPAPGASPGGTGNSGGNSGSTGNGGGNSGSTGNS